MSKLNDSISQKSSELKSTPDLNKILTIQNQLKALPDLHSQKIIASRVFAVAQQTTPPGVTISDFATDFTSNTMVITGAAQTLDRVNTFADTLKFATYSDGKQSIKPFTSVVLAQFGRSEQSTTFSIDLNIDPALFAIKSTYNLTVPKQVTSVSVTDQPTEIFKQTTTGAKQ
jgi:hypothetical protein